MRASSTVSVLGLLVAVACGGLARAADAPLPPPGRPGGPASPTPRPISQDPTATPRSPGLVVSADYRLASGDEVEIEVVLPKAVEEVTTNPFKEGRRFIVAPGGRLSVAQVKDVELLGRSLAEIQRDIVERLKAAQVADNPDVFVRVTAYAPRYVRLVGAVYRKIEISPFGRPNLLTVFAEAGEAMTDVDVGAVTVVSEGRPARRVNFRAVLAAGGATADALLDAGDILILERAVKVEPPMAVVYIGGEVAKPNVYALQEPGGSNRPITALQLFLRAGGATQYADIKDVIVRRADGSVVRVNLKAIMGGQVADLPLLADDMVVVND